MTFIRVSRSNPRVATAVDRDGQVIYLLGATRVEFDDAVASMLPDDPLEAEFQKLEAEIAARRSGTPLVDVPSADR